MTTLICLTCKTKKKSKEDVAWLRCKCGGDMWFEDSSLHSEFQYKFSPKTEYFDGKKVRTISEAHLKDIRSRITTHEGEVLRGSAGTHYRDLIKK